MALEDDIKKCWQLFAEGRLRDADSLAAKLIFEDRRYAAYLPVAQILTAKAQYLSLIGHRHAAASFLLKALNNAPMSAYPQELMLAMLREEFAARSGRRDPTQPGREGAKRGRLVIGLGTGRSGSTSLTLLLMAQKGACFAHEHPPDLSWAEAEGTDRLRFHLQRYALLTQMYDFVGDVGHWWLPRVKSIAAFFPDFRAVVMKRDRAATVESFLKVKGGGGEGSVNHWMDHDGSYWTRVPFDRCYPSYRAGSMAEAIGLYWDEYYATCDRLAEAYPGQIRTFDITALKDPAGQEEILRFCGFPDPVLPGEIHANVGSYEEGEALWGNPFEKARVAQAPGAAKPDDSTRTA